MGLSSLSSPLACSSDDIQIAAFVTSILQVSFHFIVMLLIIMCCLFRVFIHVYISILCVFVQVFADTGQGWINCILYILLSTDLRQRLFILPFQRCVRASPLINNRSNSAIAPLLGVTESVPSTRARALEEGNTYCSLPTEFPTCSNSSGPTAGYIVNYAPYTVPM